MDGSRPAGSEVGERIVFNFHGVGTPHAGLPADELPYWCPTDLYLRLLDTIAATPAQTGMPVEITFDDGNRSDLDIAAPALAERGLSATFFVCSGRLDDPRYLDAAALQALVGLGMRVGSHGRDHVDLRRADAATLAEETDGSQRTLSAALGAAVDAYAIPFGSYDRRVLSALGGYRVIYNSDQVRAGRADRRIVPRVSYVAGWGPDTPTELAAARYSPIQRQKNNLKFLLKRLR